MCKHKYVHVYDRRTSHDTSMCTHVSVSCACAGVCMYIPCARVQLRAAFLDVCVARLTGTPFCICTTRYHRSRCRKSGATHRTARCAAASLRACRVVRTAPTMRFRCNGSQRVFSRSPPISNGARKGSRSVPEQIAA